MSALATAYSEAPNLAPGMPLEPLVEERSNDQTVWIDDPLKWFKEVRKEIEEENAGVWKDSVLLWEMIYLFIEGKHLLKRAKYGTGWRAVPLPDRTDSPVYSYNLAGFYSDNIKSKWTNSRTGIKWRPSSDKDQAMGSAKAGGNAYDFYARKIYTETFRQNEATLAQCGKYARYYYYSKDVKSYARRPRVEEQQLQFGESAYLCPDCGSSGVLPASGTGAQFGLGHSDSVPQPEVERPDVGAYARNAAGVPASTSAPSLNGGSAAIASAQGGLNGLGQWDQLGNGSSQSGLNALGSTLGAETPQSGAISTADDSASLPALGQSESLLGNAGGCDSAASGICPDCGSPNAELTESSPFTVEAVTGYEEIESGSICCESPPAFELKHDLTFQPQDSPYLMRTRRVRLSILQSKFPFLKLKASKGDYSGLDAADDLKRSTYASSNRTRSKGDDSAEKTADFVQLWLDPAMYDQYAFRSEYKTVGGATIPAGTKLIELCPDGMYLCWVQGVEGLVEYRNEHHKQFWVGGNLRQRAISSLGSGIEDIIEGNRQYNLIMSLIYTILRSAATPATLYDETLLPNGVSAYLANPLKNVPVNTTGIENKSIRDAVHQLAPQPPSGQHFSYAQQLDYFCQKASRVTDFSGGLPGVNNETATGAEISSANSQSLFAPQLALKADVDRRGAEIILELFKLYCIDEVYVSLAGKRGKQDGIWLSATDLAVDLFAEVVPESFLPQTNLERRQRFKNLLMDVGGLMGLKMAMSEMPALLERLSETYDVDLGAEDYTAAAETARQRIDQMAQAIPMLQMSMASMPMVQMAPDPVTGQMIQVPVDPMAEAGQFLLSILTPPIEVEEIGHLAAINVYRDWLTTDEGKEAPMELRAGVKAAIYRHVEGLMAEAQMTGMVGMAGQPMPVEEPQEGPPKKNSNPDAKQMGGGKNRQTEVAV